MTKINACREILRKKRRCFRCLKGSHIAKSCRVQVKCYKCKAVGNHHTALCQEVKRYTLNNYKSNNEENDGVHGVQTTCLVDGKQSVLLQTAICNVIGNNQRVVVVKALFNSCSQQTYISNRLVKILNLKPLRDISMIRMFCSEAKTLYVKEYEIKIQLLHGEVLPIKAIAIPKNM